MSAALNAKEYARWKRQLWFLDLGITAGVLVGILASGLGVRLSGWVQSQIAFWPLQVMVYVGILWIGMVAIGLPLDWFRNFKLEHRFGLSTQSLKKWFGEYAKQLALGGALGLVLVESLSLLLRITPNSWWVWAAFLWLFWSVLLTRVGPTLLIPIFYRQTPLKDAALRDRLESFLKRCGTKVCGIFELNLSSTTRKANACLTGLGSTRRVLVSDTLLSNYPAEEIEVVLAHEVGHHQLHHIGLLILVSAVATALSCFGVDWAARASLGLLGLATLSDPAALPLIGLGLFAANLILMPVTHGVSRRLEAQADQFALDQTQDPKAFIATMRRLAQQNLAELEPPHWVEWLLYDHPSIARRIAMAEGWKA